ELCRHRDHADARPPASSDINRKPHPQVTVEQPVLLTQAPLLDLPAMRGGRPRGARPGGGTVLTSPKNRPCYGPGLPCLTGPPRGAVGRAERGRWGRAAWRYGRTTRATALGPV